MPDSPPPCQRLAFGSRGQGVGLTACQFIPHRPDLKPIPYELNAAWAALIQKDGKVLTIKPETLMVDAIDGALRRLCREMATCKRAGQGRFLTVEEVEGNPLKKRLRERHGHLGRHRFLGA